MCIAGKWSLVLVMIFGQWCSTTMCVLAASECDMTELLQRNKRVRVIPSGEQVLQSVVEAYESKNGLIISGTSTPHNIQPDHSGSILRSDFPPMIATYVGLILEPSTRPGVLCGFVVDGGTDHRKSQSGSLCGWAFPEFQDISVQCNFPPQEYAEHYRLKPIAKLKQYGETAVEVWAVTQAACSFKSIDDLLVAEEGFWKMVGSLTKEEWEQWGQARLGTWSGPTGFNEIVFTEEVYDGRSDDNWVAIYWAHTGDFISDWSQTDKYMRKGPCCITMNAKGKWCESTSRRPVIEIANVDFVGWGAQYNSTGISEYTKMASANGANGYSGSKIFRVLPQAELCRLDCSAWNAATCVGWSM